MSHRHPTTVGAHIRPSTGFVALLAVALMASTSWAGHFGFRGGAVGGISVDAEGVVRNVNIDARNNLWQAMRKGVKAVAAELNQPVELRMVSMKGLHAAIDAAKRDNVGHLPDEVKFLAGLQRIQYVLLVPEENDIVLVGPAEGWKVDENANVVGVTTGLPVIQLDDLLIAFRGAAPARREGITCSIEPTVEGQKQFQQFLSRKGNQEFSPAVKAGMEKAMGPQLVKLTGVPADSHLARVMVAADYHMKRLAMNMDKAPVADLPGYLDMVAAKRAKLTNSQPRWWLACNYEPIQRSEDGLSWEIRGQGVKAMTEDDLIGSDGVARRTGKQNQLAQQWADKMTTHYEELSKKNVIFGELRNVMDLCVIAALIDQERLLDKVGCSIPLITDAESAEPKLDAWPTPKTISTQCSFIQGRGEWIVATSGGVQIESFAVASRTEVNADLKLLRDKTGIRGTKPWWWN